MEPSRVTSSLSTGSGGAASDKHDIYAAPTHEQVGLSIFEPTCAYARWALMHSFLSVRKLSYNLIY